MSELTRCDLCGVYSRGAACDCLVRLRQRLTDAEARAYDGDSVIKKLRVYLADAADRAERAERERDEAKDAARVAEIRRATMAAGFRWHAAAFAYAWKCLARRHRRMRFEAEAIANDAMRVGLQAVEAERWHGNSFSARARAERSEKRARAWKSLAKRYRHIVRMGRFVREYAAIKAAERQRAK